MATKKEFATVAVLGVALGLSMAYAGSYQLELNPNNIGAMLIMTVGLVDAVGATLGLVLGLKSKTLFSQRSLSC